MTIQPSFEDFKSFVETEKEEAQAESTLPPNLYPVYAFELADSLTPHNAYLKLSKPHSDDPKPSFLLESAIGGERVDRYSFIGVNPRKTIKTGNGFGPDVDPLNVLEEELNQFRQSKKNSGAIPRLSGGAVGYVSYDCIKYFEPKTARDLKDPLGIPEAALMLFDTIVAFDNVYQRIQVIHNIYIPDDSKQSMDSLKAKYDEACEIISSIFKTLKFDEVVNPPQSPISVNDEYVSNIGQSGYESHVTNLKDHILKGDIFQAVPSQRVTHKTKLHPFNIYRHLRTINPSPYLFYLDYIDFQVVGASPELLVKSEKGRIITHPIAGTLKRGKTTEEDDKLAAELLASTKDRAEHVMLVDLARNDINRICDPNSTSVDRLLTVERFSHVMHLVSQVSGVLRSGKSRFDAFRSIFPAGTVSGAPKIRAMQLIGELEGERRGIYAGAVGHWGYDDRQMDTCIALRTMFVKDETVYLQAGGGIVHDSDPYDEYIETVNKMNSNVVCIKQAEELWASKN